MSPDPLSWIVVAGKERKLRGNVSSPLGCCKECGDPDLALSLRPCQLVTCLIEQRSRWCAQRPFLVDSVLSDISVRFLSVSMCLGMNTQDYEVEHLVMYPEGEITSAPSCFQNL